MRIRKAKLTDIEELVKLLSYLFEQEVEFKADTKKQAKGLSLILSNKKVGDIFVATKKNKIVGMVNLLYSVSTSLGSKVGIIEDVVVSPKYRGQDIGSKLLLHVKTFAKRKKLKRLTLFTDFDNLKAHTFYEKQGFKRSSMVQFKKEEN
ncbi:GNAT family N-acetyltransferase [Sulfurospirillum arcachonense]|uniref:GNAT family N-acetyltransferase n=1 Tax=Sulfurospirillum arcachonense TaxID=57666 RepID=UPI0004687CD9|nr:GNAT family N-acetyltransferase [Sulfurospirillum arcachonense]